MKTRFLFLLSLLVMFSLSGCDEDCATVDCIQEPFRFRVLNAQGENLLDNGTLALSQIAIYTPGAPAATLPLSAYAPLGETYVEAGLSQNTRAYTLAIDGYAPLELSFDLDVRSGDCCTSLTIEEAYLNEAPVLKDSKGERFIILP
ncbi:hypothetical protein [Pontibacter akesuensis]|nr:hypothetical protein [Pontibacter akesuensis]GHA66955.1 hypothetical protein GCM10007389_20060 [Pontibacter akesuensis]